MGGRLPARPLLMSQSPHLQPVRVLPDRPPHAPPPPHLQPVRSPPSPPPACPPPPHLKPVRVLPARPPHAALEVGRAALVGVDLAQQDDGDRVLITALALGGLDPLGQKVIRSSTPESGRGRGGVSLSCPIVGEITGG